LFYILYNNLHSGSEQQANEFDDLPPEESKKRLRIIALKMDVDKVFVNWVIHNLNAGWIHY
jgi:hypothetical protein